MWLPVPPLSSLPPRAWIMGRAAFIRIENSPGLKSPRRMARVAASSAVIM